MVVRQMYFFLLLSLLLCSDDAKSLSIFAAAAAAPKHFVVGFATSSLSILSFSPPFLRHCSQPVSLHSLQLSSSLVSSMRRPQNTRDDGQNGKESDKQSVSQSVSRSVGRSVKSASCDIDSLQPRRARSETGRKKCLCLSRHNGDRLPHHVSRSPHFCLVKRQHEEFCRQRRKCKQLDSKTTHLNSFPRRVFSPRSPPPSPPAACFLSSLQR